MSVSHMIPIGKVVVITKPAVYQVDPKTRKCKTELQAFEVTGYDAQGNADLKPTNEPPECYLELGGGYRLG